MLERVRKWQCSSGITKIYYWYCLLSINTVQENNCLKSHNSDIKLTYCETCTEDYLVALISITYLIPSQLHSFIYLYISLILINVRQRKVLTRVYKHPLYPTAECGHHGLQEEVQLPLPPGLQVRQEQTIDNRYLHMSTYLSKLLSKPELTVNILLSVSLILQNWLQCFQNNLSQWDRFYVSAP